MGESPAKLSDDIRLILASASPARRELLGRLGHPFEVLPADIDEPTTGFADPQSFVQTVAWLKARAIAEKLAPSTTTEIPTIILAADTIGWIDDQPILKPTDEADARRILRLLGGRDHELWTGVVLWRLTDGVQLTWQECTRVTVTTMSDPELENYLATREWANNSGAYAIREQNDPHVRVVEGSITNVIGLPMESLTRHLRWLVAAPQG